MSRRATYTATFLDVNVSAIQDLFSFAPQSNRPIEVVAIRLFQTSDYGDAQAEGLPVHMIRGHTAAGTGGTVVTPTPLDANSAGASTTVRANDATTVASGGTPVVMPDLSFNIQAGAIEVYPETMRPRVGSPQGLLVVRLRAAPADPVTMSGTVWYSEL